MNLDAFLDNTADGVCSIGPAGKILNWNRAAEEILGYKQADVVGKQCNEIVAGRDPAGNLFCCGFCTVRLQAKMGEPIRHFEMSTKTNDGTPVWLDVSSLSVPANGDSPPTVVHLFRDVTRSHELESLVRQKLEPVASGNGHEPLRERPELPADLTAREQQVLRLMAQGMTTTALAESLFISRTTVRNHVQNILGKLDVHSRLEAVAYANRCGV